MAKHTEKEVKEEVMLVKGSLEWNKAKQEARAELDIRTNAVRQA